MSGTFLPFTVAGCYANLMIIKVAHHYLVKIVGCESQSLVVGGTGCCGLMVDGTEDSPSAFRHVAG